MAQAAAYPDDRGDLLDALRSMMLMLMAMAALSQLIAIFESDGDGGGVAFICGLCAAACMLKALNAVVAGLLS